jgi:hypothetical protein
MTAVVDSGTYATLLLCTQHCSGSAASTAGAAPALTMTDAKSAASLAARCTPASHHVRRASTAMSAAKRTCKDISSCYSSRPAATSAALTAAVNTCSKCPREAGWCPAEQRRQNRGGARATLAIIYHHDCCGTRMQSAVDLHASLYFHYCRLTRSDGKHSFIPCWLPANLATAEQISGRRRQGLVSTSYAICPCLAIEESRLGLAAAQCAFEPTTYSALCKARLPLLMSIDSASPLTQSSSREHAG